MKFLSSAVIGSVASALLFSNGVEGTLCAEGLPANIKAGDSFRLTTASNPLGATAAGNIVVVDQCNVRIADAAFTNIPANTYLYGLFTNDLGYRLSNTPLTNLTGTSPNYRFIDDDLGTGRGVGISLKDFNTFRVFMEYPNVTNRSGIIIANAPITTAPTTTTPVGSTTTPSSSPTNRPSTPSSPTNSATTVQTMNGASLLGALASLFMFF